MRHKPLFALGATLVLTLNCAVYMQLEHRARSKYQQGDYDGAVYDAAASLRHKPDNPDAQNLIQEAFRVAVNRHLDQVNAGKASNAKHKWDAVVADYTALVSLNRTIRDLPVLTNKSSPTGVITLTTADFTTELEAARRSAAETHYQEGLRLSRSDEVDVQRQATQEFRAAEGFLPGYKDAAVRAVASKKAATRHLAIIPFDDKSGRRANYGDLRERIIDEIVGDVMNDAAATEFLEVVSRDRLEQVMREQQFQASGLVDPETAVRLGRLLGAHDILTGRITQILYTPPATVKRTTETDAEVVLRTETYKDSLGFDQTREIKGHVQANVTIYTKTASASIAGSYSLIEVKTAAVRKTESFEKRRDFTYEWATYTGDKRALGQYAGLCDRPEAVAPSEAELVTGAATELSHSLAASLKAFLK
jgi:hypothetical protein